MDREFEPRDEDAQQAADVLVRWLDSSPPDDTVAALSQQISTYPVLSRLYPTTFQVGASYRASLPDLQNGPASLIKGARSEIQHVGISNFRVPIRFKGPGGTEQVLQTAITGTVSLDADNKGINMSRIMRSFYKHSEAHFNFDVADAVLDAYKVDLNSLHARLQLQLSYPMKITSLRSGLAGYQYYNIALEIVERDGVRKRIIHLDYVYSSTCPCSLELSEHARKTRGQLATPHSQRSVARISLELLEHRHLYFEDIVAQCRQALPTETQVMVKREDEQAFAELNAANPVFVEDAARLLCKAFESDPRIGDLRIVASHQESLHSHDAVSVLYVGDTFAQDSLEPRMFASLVHSG